MINKRNLMLSGAASAFGLVLPIKFLAAKDREYTPEEVYAFQQWFAKQPSVWVVDVPEEIICGRWSIERMISVCNYVSENVGNRANLLVVPDLASCMLCVRRLKWPENMTYNHQNLFARSFCGYFETKNVYIDLRPERIEATKDFLAFF